MSASWSATDLCTEIKNIGQLWKRRGVLQVSTAMVSNVIKKMESISLQATQGIVLYEAIEAAQLEETLKNRLCEAVDNLLLQESTAPLSQAWAHTLVKGFVMSSCT